MNPDFDASNRDETLDSTPEERSKLARKAMARRKIEEYLEEKELRQLLYDDLDVETERLSRRQDTPTQINESI